MRLRFVLPLTSVLLGALLFYLGDLQVRRLVEKYGAYEGTQDGTAMAKYVHYALNAPAWALLGDTRNRLWSWSTYWTGHDLYYFLVVIVMWFLIGLKLDRRLSGKRGECASQKRWWCKLLSWAYVSYGLFVCYSVLPHRPYSMTLKDYLLASLNEMQSRNPWWYLVGFAWGLGLVIAGLYSMFRTEKSAAS